MIWVTEVCNRVGRGRLVLSLKYSEGHCFSVLLRCQTECIILTYIDTTERVTAMTGANSACGRLDKPDLVGLTVELRSLIFVFHGIKISPCIDKYMANMNVVFAFSMPHEIQTYIIKRSDQYLCHLNFFISLYVLNLL